MVETEYVLGTHHRELERLGRQHEVWKANALAAWRLAGVGPGHTVLDIGAGPGYAALDLASLVEPGGKVIAVERSRRFLEALERTAATRGLTNVHTVEADLLEADLGDEIADVAWCRWVLSFVAKPGQVIDRVARALRHGGIAIFHEYVDYGRWSLIPRCPDLDLFVREVMASWRDAGGEPDVAGYIVSQLSRVGLTIVSIRPHCATVAPGDPLWEWLAEFVGSGVERLVGTGRLTAHAGERVMAAMRNAACNPNSRMATPCALEIVARSACRRDST